MSEPSYFIRQGDRVQGPFSADRIRAWIASGRVRPEMELSEDGTNFRRGDSIPGLFDAAPTTVAVANETAPRAGRDRDEGERPTRTRSASRPPPPASIIVIGCRLLGVIALVVALAFGQWAQVTIPNDRPESGGPDSKILFGLTRVSIYHAHGATIIAADSYPYSDVESAPGTPRGATKESADEMRAAASVSSTLGLVIGALVLAAALLSLGAFGDLFGKPKLSVLAAFGLLAAIGATILGWVFMNVGFAVEFARMFSAASAGQWKGKPSGAFSFYTLILALLILAIAWTRSRVVAMDASRRASLPPPPKRRRR